MIDSQIGLWCLSMLMAQADDVVLEAREIQAGSTTYQADLGTLTVPENREDEATRTIDLTFVRLRSTSRDPGPPLFFLAGGPGDAATPMARSQVWEAFLELGDVVLLDQRGTGRSEPDLRFSDAAFDPRRLLGTREEAVAEVIRVAREGAVHFAAQGIDLRGYTVVQSADDFDALREALGASQMRLLGHSFGTHLGLTMLRRFGERVESFVSVGTAGMDDIHKLPADSDQSLRQLSERVAADELVGAQMPELYETFGGLMEWLEDEPIIVDVTDPEGRALEVSVGPHGFQLIVLMDLGDRSDLPVLPRLIYDVDRGDTRLLSWFVEKRLSSLAQLPVLRMVERGASGASQARWHQIEQQCESSAFGRARHFFSPEVDAVLGTVDLGEAFRQPVTSDVRTLFVSGSMDAHTPPAQAERVRRGFSNAGHLVVEFGGHEDLLPNPEVIERILAFLQGSEPQDELLPGSPISFVPLTGDVGQALHPSLDRLR